MSRIAFVLTQDRGGPADVTLALARALIASKRHEIQVFGPPFAQPAELLDGHFVETRIDKKENLSAARRMRSALRSWAPDIVHAQDRRAALVTAGLGRRGEKPVALIHTYHGVPEDTGEAWFAGKEQARPPSVRSRAVLAADALLSRQIDRIVVPSTTMRDFLTSRLRVPAHKIVHIDNGVYLPDARPAVGPIRRLLFVGLLIPRKGLVDLLLALERPGVMPPDATLTIAGDGPSRDEAEAIARRGSLRGRVAFLGYRTDVADLLSNYDALVLPSRMEQQPLVIAQAMGAGRPVLATRTGGVAEMLEIPEFPGYLAPPGDVDGLAATLVRMFNEPHAEQLGKVLSDRARHRYSIAVSAASHLDLYHDILTGGRRNMIGVCRSLPKAFVGLTM
jgi:glycosyltransferase involved in cell wall biosynthesis